MRICHLVNIGHEAGGAEKSVRMLAEGMRARHHTVNVIATDHRVDEAPLFADTIVPAVTGNAVARLAGFYWSWGVYRAVRAALADIRPDVVHLHTIGLFSPSVLDATASYRRVLTVHGPEDWTLKLLGWNQGRSSADGTPQSAWDRARYVYLRFLQRPAYRLRLRRLDCIITPSGFYAEAIRQDVPSVPVHVVPNGIDLPSTTPLIHPRRFVFVGRFEQSKGVRVLVEAFARVAAERPDVELVMAGDGPLRAETAEAVAARGLTDRVQLPGWLSGAELRAVYADAGVVIVPSVFPENLPTVAIEALGAGRAIVGSAHGGIPELVTDEVNGLLVPPTDVGALARAIDRLADDPREVRRMGAEAARRAPDYSIERMLDRVEHQYRTVLRAETSPGTVA